MFIVGVITGVLGTLAVLIVISTIFDDKDLKK